MPRPGGQAGYSAKESYKELLRKKEIENLA